MRFPSIPFYLTSLNLVLLAACATDQQQALDYETPGVKSTADRLVIPPDITGISAQDKYTLPKGAVRATQYEKSKHNDAGEILPTFKKAHIERAGNQRWLVIEDATLDQIWSNLREFWENSGFIIKKEDKGTGIMETEWAQNQASIPSDPIRNFITRIGLGSAYSSAYRDKFTIRVERTGQGGSIVSFTNQRREEIYLDRDHTRTKWVSRPRDINLEAQFLGRYLLALGYDKNQIEQELTLNPKNLLASEKEGILYLQGAHNRNIYRLGLALERVGLTILGKKDENTFIVSPALDTANNPKNSDFFSRIFKKESTKEKIDSAQREKIYVIISRIDNGDKVVIKGVNGERYPQQDRIIHELYLQLR